MSTMRVEIQAIECPHCGASVDLGPAKDHASYDALVEHAETTVEAHLTVCPSAPRDVEAAE